MEFDDAVIKFAIGEGISNEELETMVRRAAINTIYEKFNRRFHQWLFRVVDGRVEAMEQVPELVTVGLDRGHGHMQEEHDACEGLGCEDCRWKGEVIRFL